MQIPNNIIIAWSGAINEIPNKWFLCNGSNETPDLRNRFIVGAGSTYSLNATGGSANAIVVSHTHTGSTNTTGDHSHTVNLFAYDFYSNSNFRVVSNFSQSNNHTWNTTGNHSHTISMDNTGTSGTNANLPPYYALAYIMYGGN